MSKDDDDDLPGFDDAMQVGPHELFLSEEPGSEHPRVVWISVKRFSTAGIEKAGRTFSAEELPNEEAVVRRFGGGEYVLTARDENKHPTAVRRGVLGVGVPPKALMANEEHERLAQARAAQMREPMNAATAQVAEFREAMKLQVDMMQRILDQQNTRIGEAERARELAIERMVQSQAETSKLMLQSQSEFTSTVLKIMSDNASKSSGGAEELIAGMELGREWGNQVAASSEPKSELSDIAESVGTMLQGMAAGRGGAPPAMPAPPVDGGL
jgi:hypothetical protein